MPAVLVEKAECYPINQERRRRDQCSFMQCDQRGWKHYAGGATSRSGTRNHHLESRYGCDLAQQQHSQAHRHAQETEEQRMACRRDGPLQHDDDGYIFLKRWTL